MSGREREGGGRVNVLSCLLRYDTYIRRNGKGVLIHSIAQTTCLL